MQIWLQTRGVVRDYDFIGATPSNFWWNDSVYAEMTAFEKPSLILEQSGEGRWRCLISAIPSRRCDRVQTPIRYTLFLAGTSDDQGILLNVIGSALAAFETSPPVLDTQLTRFLDEAVGGKVDEWLENRLKEAQKCVEGLSAWFATLTPPSMDEKLAKEIRSLVVGALDSAEAIVLLNFIASEQDPLAVELQAASQVKVLVLPSPVAGGRLEELFSLTPSPTSSEQMQVRNDCKWDEFLGRNKNYLIISFLFFVFIVFVLLYSINN